MFFFVENIQKEALIRMYPDSSLMSETYRLQFFNAISLQTVYAGQLGAFRICRLLFTNCLFTGHLFPVPAHSRAGSDCAG